jgi:HK97 family phage major capsid protein
MSFELLSEEVRDTVTDFRQTIEKTNDRIDGIEAMLKRAASHVTNDEVAGIETEDGRGQLPIYRKEHSLVAAQHGREGIRQASGISLGRLLKGIATGNWRGADQEQELCIKAQGFGSGPAGGFLLPSLVDSMILDLARPVSVTQRMGAGFVNVEGFTALPRLTGDITPVWRQENSEITESAMTFGTINVQPKSVGFLVRSSRELIEDSGPDLDRFIRQVFAAAYGSELDRIVLSGAGVTEPTGITGTTGINTSAIGGSVDWDDFVDGAKEIFLDNFAGTYGELGMVVNPRTYASLAKLKGTANDHYLAPPEPVREMMRAQTTHLAIDGSSNTQAIVGDFRQVAIAQRVGLSVAVSGQESDAFKKNQITFRAIARLDVAVFRPQWFTVLTGISN